MDFTLIGQAAAGDDAAAVAGVGFLLIWFLCMGVSLLLSVLTTVFWVWMIIDCATKEPGKDNDKIIWLLVVILLNWIGAAVYYFVRRPQRIAKYGQ